VDSKEIYATLTLTGFDDQERSLTFVKGLKLKFHTCNFKQAFYLLHKLRIVWPWQHILL